MDSINISSPNSTIVIVGAGHAGGRAAGALRSNGFTGRLVLIGEEEWLPYERPALSKELLAGTIAVQKTYLHARDYYEQKAIELRLGARVELLDRSGRQVILSDGSRVRYDLLLLATGARARPLNVPGADSRRVHYVRTISDSLKLRELLRPGACILVVGAGFIGLEVAAAARAKDCAVTVLESAALPLGRVAAPEIGEFFGDLHRANGVDLRTGATVAALGEIGNRIRATLASGEELDADAIVAGIGAVPNTELADAAGLAVDNGIIVDEFGHTSDPAIYAVGDVTRHPNPLLGRHVRLETWQNAENQSTAVAKAMCGASEPYAEVPWFWTNQYDLNFQSAGNIVNWDRAVWRGQRNGGRCTVFYLNGGAVVGGACINNGRDMRFVKQMIASGRRPDAGALGNPDTKLADLCR